MKNNTKQITLQDIAVTVGGILDSRLKKKFITQVGNLNSDLTASTLVWCSEENAAFLDTIKDGVILISKSTYSLRDRKNTRPIFIGVDNPRRAFAKILAEYFEESVPWGNIASSAHLDKSVMFNPNKVNIGHNVVIESDVIIGDYVMIGHNSVIKSRTEIKNNVQIGSNCTIGSVGFGYEKSKRGQYEFIPHIGNVKIESNVEIGNNVCIDRAVVGSTILQSNVKIDNLVHISHGVNVGKNSLVIAHAMVAGSVNIGENVWIAPCASIKQKLNISDNAFVGLASVVLKDVQVGETVVGAPAKPISK